jgi:hypothetical protein
MVLTVEHVKLDRVLKPAGSRWGAHPGGKANAHLKDEHGEALLIPLLQRDEHPLTRSLSSNFDYAGTRLFGHG